MIAKWKAHVRTKSKEELLLINHQLIELEKIEPPSGFVGQETSPLDLFGYQVCRLHTWQKATHPARSGWPCYRHPRLKT
ncbi:UNVERIFIED_CONTAM: hypothetical protein Slati_0983500 [Sesamum latifolium]|uniref:Uncharacterized protein n=1 Tax=Sesamum latifolium TaxID=2727402 RepID=A0AAW2XS51_9LAMI